MALAIVASISARSPRLLVAPRASVAMLAREGGGVCPRLPPPEQSAASQTATLALG